MDRVLLSNYLLENHTVQIREKSLVINRKTYTASSAKAFVKDLIEPNRKEISKIDSDFAFFSETEMVEGIKAILEPTISHLYDEEKKRRIQNVTKNIPTTDISFYRDDLYPVIDASCPNGSSYILRKDNHRVLIDITEKAWAKQVGSSHVKELQEASSRMGHFIYNPRNLETKQSIKTHIGVEDFYNLYTPPTHLVTRDYEAKLHPHFIEFLEGFFLDESREYAYNWIYHSLSKKMPTYMVLVGAGGIGKNLLAEVMSKLHGAHNFKKAPSSALTKEFSGYLTNCTVLYFDECKFSGDAKEVTQRKNKLKDWANDYVSIEKKGKDAETLDIYCSGIISTNNVSDVHLEYLDRKFSPMEISDQRLEKRLGVEKTQFVWKYINDEKFPDALMNYLEERIDKNFEYHKEHRGSHFNKLVISSLYEWQRLLVFEYILNADREDLSIAEIRKSISSFPSNNDKVADFLKNFIYEGDTIATVEYSKQRRQVFIKVNPKYINKEIKGDL